MKLIFSVSVLEKKFSIDFSYSNVVFYDSSGTFNILNLVTQKTIEHKIEGSIVHISWNTNNLIIALEKSLIVIYDYVEKKILRSIKFDGALSVFSIGFKEYGVKRMNDACIINQQGEIKQLLEESNIYSISDDLYCVADNKNMMLKSRIGGETLISKAIENPPIFDIYNGKIYYFENNNIYGYDLNVNVICTTKIVEMKIGKKFIFLFSKKTSEIIIYKKSGDLYGYINNVEDFDYCSSRNEIMYIKDKMFCISTLVSLPNQEFRNTNRYEVYFEEEDEFDISDPEYKDIETY